MFETIDNVTMIKESTGDLSRMRGSASSAAAGSRSATAIPSGARTRCGQMAPLGARPRCVCAHGPALAGMTQRVQAIAKRARHLHGAQASAGVHRGRRIGHHGEGRPGATRHRRMEIRAAITTTRRREPRCATEATDIRLSSVVQCEAVRRVPRFPGKSLYVRPQKLSRAECLWFFSVQHARR